MIRSFLQRAGLFTFAALLISSMALAQPQADDPPEDASDEELEKVADVLVQIEEVRHKYQAKIQDASNDDQIRTYQTEMATKIEDVIAESDDITTERYEEVTRAAEADDDLKQRILSLVREKRSK